MPSLELAAGDLRVSYPDSYRVPTRSAASKGPKRPPDDVSSALLDAFAEQGLELMEAFELVPVHPAGTSRRPGTQSARRGKLRVALDLPEGQDAVVLLEQDGFLSWHLPKSRDGAARSHPASSRRATGPPGRGPAGPVARVARFEIDVQPVAPTRVRARALTRSAKGPFGDVVVGGFTATVLTFVFRPVAGAVISFLERGTHPGLVRITGNDVKSWPLVDSLSQVPLPDDRPARILLLVHGTFSTTVGSFGALTSTAEGQRLLQAAAGSYDAVIGFDHRTLSRDPLENAIDLETRLKARRLAFTPTIDMVTYSRGALVGRSLVEYLLPSSTWPADIGKVAFVGGTNAGTQLAEPENLKNFVDLYTNLAAATARSIAAGKGSTQAAEILRGLVQGVGALVKYLVVVAITKGGVPGLAAMEPDGTFITEINGTQPGQPTAGTPWHVISSNFEVAQALDGQHGQHGQRGQHSQPALPAELLLKLADGLADRLMGVKNDLVVDTASMSSVDLPSGGGFIKESLTFGTNDVVHHLNYLIQPRTCEALRSWLT